MIFEVLLINFVKNPDFFAKVFCKSRKRSSVNSGKVRNSRGPERARDARPERDAAPGTGGWPATSRKDTDHRGGIVGPGTVGIIAGTSSEHCCAGQRQRGKAPHVNSGRGVASEADRPSGRSFGVARDHEVRAAIGTVKRHVECSGWGLGRLRRAFSN